VDRPPPPGPHGGDAERIAAWLGRPVADILDLSISLNPVPPDLEPVVDAARASLRRYPDPGPATEALAEAIGVDARLVAVTNGGAEAIALVARLEPLADLHEPEFSLYRRHVSEVRRGAPRWRSNPNSPLGRLASPEERAAVWDEAFYPLATGAWTRGDSDAWRLGSLTKLWACPGVRVGYAIAPTPDAAARLRDLQPRWSVSALALASIDLLLPGTDLGAASSTVGRLRRTLVTELTRRGLHVEDTDACWVLVHRAGLRDELAAHGVLVRDCTSFGLPGIARIGVPDDDGRARLLDAIDVLP
jgi:histidinol-phosphate/aromatic aminotransferase/cobyric acid decarboxylase-like protein